MKTTTFKTPISRVAYSVEPHPTIPGLWVHRRMQVNGAVQSFLIDDGALEFVMEACAGRLAELREKKP